MQIGLDGAPGTGTARASGSLLQGRHADRHAARLELLWCMDRIPLGAHKTKLGRQCGKVVAVAGRLGGGRDFTQVKSKEPQERAMQWRPLVLIHKCSRLTSKMASRKMGKKMGNAHALTAGTCALHALHAWLRTRDAEVMARPWERGHRIAIAMVQVTGPENLVNMRRGREEKKGKRKAMVMEMEGEMESEMGVREEEK